ncbi:Rapid alkalinization factor [Melia azedarach]|uniref:Rapid alkalinization factor n=1 Tax=Melia azedarach TaxID=155640 RepID=A0ACC1YGQ3_MELAZ|nr:Rapid alkalinization factor [Melia azedarach]
MRASNFSGFLLVVSVLILAVHVAVSSSSSIDFDGGGQLDFFPVKSECRGSIAECMAVDDEDFDLEFAMDSEINRRILAGRRYISYGALRRNTVPCSRRGASYYNCRAGGQANPYSRGCSAITRCRR